MLVDLLYKRESILRLSLLHKFPKLVETNRLPMIKVSTVLYTAQIDAKFTHLGKMCRLAYTSDFVLSSRFFHLVDMIDGVVSGLRKSMGLDFPVQDYGEGVCRIMLTAVSKLGVPPGDKAELVEDLVSDFVTDNLSPNSTFLTTLKEKSQDPNESKDRILGGGIFVRAQHFAIDSLYKSNKYRKNLTYRLRNKDSETFSYEDPSPEDTTDINSLPFVREFRRFLRDTASSASPKQKEILNRVLQRFNDYISGNKENNDTSKQIDLKRMNELLSTFISKNPKFKAFGDSMDRHKVVVAAEYDLRKATEKYWATVPARVRSVYLSQMSKISDLYDTLRTYRDMGVTEAEEAKTLVNQILSYEKQLSDSYDTLGKSSEAEAMSIARQKLLKVAPEYRHLLSSGGLSAAGIWVEESTLDKAYARRQLLQQVVSKIDKVLGSNHLR